MLQQPLGISLDSVDYNRWRHHGHKRFGFSAFSRTYSLLLVLAPLSWLDRMPPLCVFFRGVRARANRQPKLCYIGFSQGTAMAFAAFSSNPDLLEKVQLFVALSPAVRANHLSKSLLLSLVQANLRCAWQENALSAALSLSTKESSLFLLVLHRLFVSVLRSWRETSLRAPRKRL